MMTDTLKIKGWSGSRALKGRESGVNWMAGKMILKIGEKAWHGMAACLKAQKFYDLQLTRLLTYQNVVTQSVACGRRKRKSVL